MFCYLIPLPTLSKVTISQTFRDVVLFKFESFPQNHLQNRILHTIFEKFLRFISNNLTINHMLLEFSCANFRSIHKVCTLSMVAQKITDEPKNNIAYVNDKLNILKTAAIYGANSSGKSNVLNAFASMVWHIIYSVKLNDGDELRYEPFKLSSAGKEATYYEAKFILNGQTYRYGFEHDDKTIISEWLYSSSIGSKKEQILFLRNEDGIGVNEKSFPEGVDKEESTVENRLFLSLCAQLNGKCSKQIIDKFKTFNVISGINSNRYAGYSKAMLHKQ